MRRFMYMFSYVFCLAWHLGTDWFNTVAEGKLLCMFRKYHEHVVPRDFFMDLFDSGWL
jgi:nucleoside permease NupC